MIINFLGGNSPAKVCREYGDGASLFEGLRRERDDAIRCLYSRVSGPVFKLGKSAGLSVADSEVLLCDCIALFLEKIRDGGYVFQGYEPGSYLIEIFKNKARTEARRRSKLSPMEAHSVDEAAEMPEYTSREAAESLEQVLKNLAPNCQNLIRLKYLEEKNDKEIIELNLTQYTTVNALKNHRAQCMKKLIELAEQMRHFY